MGSGNAEASISQLIHVVGVPGPPRWNDRDLVQPVGPSAGLADADLVLHADNPASLGCALETQNADPLPDGRHTFMCSGYQGAPCGMSPPRVPSSPTCPP